MAGYMVSARKYRPATFETVVGQGHITSTLRNAISRGQLAHAYLFCGPRGVGKTTCARIFAKAINCLSPGGDAQVCGECESCRAFDEGRSFNIHELDAASNNSVDDIRSLTEQVRIPPQIGKYSVYIIDEVHMLSAQAFNAFLKTLEEPPAHAVFILATTEKHKIIPTILSRCQIFDFNRIRVEDGVGYLRHIAEQEGVEADDESLHLIARKADGGMRDALSMFDKAVSFCGTKLDYKEVAATLNVLDYDTYFTITEQLLAGDYPSALRDFDAILSQGFSPQVFVTGMNGHFRDLLMTRDASTLPLLEVTGTLLEKYRTQGLTTDPGFLFGAIDLLTTLDGTLKTAANQRLNVELALMKLCVAAQKKNSELNPDTPAGAFIAWNYAEKGSAFPLPDLPGSGSAKPAAAQPAANPTGNIAATTAKVETAPAQTPAKADPEPTDPAPQPVEAKSEPEIPKVSDTTTDAPPAEAAAPAKHAENACACPAPSDAAPAKKSVRTLSGTSINDLLGKQKGYYEEEAEPEAPKKEASRIDPGSGEKIEAVAGRFFTDLDAERPRIAMAFRAMKVDGHRIALTVPTDTLREEIMRNRTEILTSLAELAEIDGILELEVTVNEKAGPKKPIKAEDKLRWLTERNPAVNDLRKKLELELE